MKTFSLVLSIILLGCQSFAASQGTDKKYSYCDDLTRIDGFVNRSGEGAESFKASGLKVERIVVSKQRKEMYLISGENILGRYTIALGQNPEGPKQFVGDGKTPEGIYSIDYKNPNSQYTKALHVSYPNKADREYAKSQGLSAGGDIMIHGFPTAGSVRVARIHPRNWTLGCIAVTNEEIEEIYSLVKENTLIEICKTPVVEESIEESETSEDSASPTTPAISTPAATPNPNHPLLRSIYRY